MKICKKCSHLFEGRACTQCKKAWYKANSEKQKVKMAIWRKNNPEKVKVYQKTYSKINAKKRLDNLKAWAKAYPQKANANNAKRRAAKLQRTPPWLTQLHFNQIQIFYDVAHQLTKEFGVEMEVDHIIPLQGKNVSGLHVPWNLQVITMIENSSKHNLY